MITAAGHCVRERLKPSAYDVCNCSAPIFYSYWHYFFWNSGVPPNINDVYALNFLQKGAITRNLIFFHILMT